MFRRPPGSPLFPYTPLSRSVVTAGAGIRHVAGNHEVIWQPRSRGENTVQLPVAERIVERLAAGPQRTGSKALNYRSEEHTSELQSHLNLVCRLLLEKTKYSS